MSSLDQTKLDLNNSLLSFVRRQSLYRCLAIVAVGLLMLWLSGSLIPQTWQVFFQSCLQFSLLVTTQGTGFLNSFLLLLVQSFLLVAAWGVYLWLALREILLFSAYRSSLMARIAGAEAAALTVSSLQGDASSPDSALAFQASSGYSAYNQDTITPFVFNPFENEIASVDTIVAPLSRSSEKPVQGGQLPSTSSEKPVRGSKLQSYTSLGERSESVTSLPTKKIGEMQAPSASVQERSRNTLKKTNLRRSSQQEPVATTKEELSSSSVVQRNSLTSFTGLQSYDQQLVPGKGSSQNKAASQSRDTRVSPEEDSEQSITLTSPGAQESGEIEQINPFYVLEAGLETQHFSSVLHELGFFAIAQPSNGQNEVQETGHDQPEILPNRPEVLPAIIARNEREVIDQMDTRLEVPEMKKLTSEANPFEVHADILELFAPANSAEEERSVQLALPSPANLPPDQMYVYGNPFEGPLPDVFQHDEELKNSVLSQVAEEQEGHSEKRKSIPGRDMSGSNRQEHTKRPPRHKNR